MSIVLEPSFITTLLRGMNLMICVDLEREEARVVGMVWCGCGYLVWVWLSGVGVATTYLVISTVETHGKGFIIC